jgi:hypothetical protein
MRHLKFSKKYSLFLTFAIPKNKTPQHAHYQTNTYLVENDSRFCSL